MAATPTAIIAASLLLTLISLTSAVPSESITNAADTLSNSGYVSMSLTLNLVSGTLLANPSAVTIFTPPDASFADSGQPSLAVLQLHFSPLAFSLSSLRSLPFGTKIPTLSSTSFLTVTTPVSSDQVSLNNVKIVGSPIFDDGLLVVFGIETFFNPNFTVSISPVQSPSFQHCTASLGGDNNFSFHESGSILVSRGYSVMASFLNLQLASFLGQPTLTVFAPVDEVMVDYSGRFPDYPSLFLRHVLPCRLSWRDLTNVENGTIMDTYLEGFKINITTSGNILRANELSVTFPDMYYSNWLVIHGLRDVLSLPEPTEEEGDLEGDSFDEIPASGADNELIAASPVRTEF